MARPPVARSSPAMLATSRGFVEYSRFSACALRRRFGCDTLNGYPVTLVDAHNIIFSRMRTYQSYIMSVNQRYRRVFPRVWWDRSGFLAAVAWGQGRGRDRDLLGMVTSR